MPEKVCGMCKWHEYDDDVDFICVNCESWHFCDYTEYNDTCEEWEERE